MTARSNVEESTPTGGLTVESSSTLRDETMDLAPADVPLYRVLDAIVDDAPGLMLARLASACDNLLDVEEKLSEVNRGSVTIENVGYGLSYIRSVREAVVDYRDQDREPVTLIGVGCSGSKYEDDELLKARNRYRGAYWSVKEDYGDAISAEDGWRVISAEYAILHPDREIPHYETTPDDLRGVPVDSSKRLPSGDTVQTLLDLWAVDVYEGLQAWITEAADGVDPRDVELELLLGRKYKHPLRDRGVFDALRVPTDLQLHFPFQEVDECLGGNGNQMGWMTDEIEAVMAEDDKADP